MVVHRRMLLAYRCFECHFMPANAAFFVLVSCLTRKMYDQTDESLYWKQSCTHGKLKRKRTEILDKNKKTMVIVMFSIQNKHLSLYVQLQTKFVKIV